LFFGWLADRMGRKKLFLITLALYAVGTAAGGITGPHLFGKLVDLLGVEAARRDLEEIATPLSAEAADAAGKDEQPADADRDRSARRAERESQIAQQRGEIRPSSRGRYVRASERTAARR
jgi:hypothetical protein